MSFKMPSKELVESIRAAHPQGTRVELVSMSDPYTTLQPGDKGTVSTVDDIGTIFVKWDNGSTLGVAYGEDRVRRVERELPGKEEAGQTVAGYNVQHSIWFDNHRGFALAHSPTAPDPYVIWQFTQNDGQRDFYWGKYCGSREQAQEIFCERVAEYQKNQRIKEVDNPLASVEMSSEQNYNMIDGLRNNMAGDKPDLTDGQTFDEMRELAPETLPQEIHPARDDKPSLLGQLERFKADSAATKTEVTATEPEPEL